MENVDVLIAGGGIAGLTLAAALDHAGLSVMLVDPGHPGADLRSTAYLLPARTLFETIGLWDSLSSKTTPLSALQVIDTTGWPPEISQNRTFTPNDLGAEHFGWNIPNEVARKTLLTHLEKQPNVTLALGIGFKNMLTRTNEVRVRLTDGRQIRCRLVVGADGRTSQVRDAAGISIETKRYGQKALAFHATHALPHNNVSTEIYNQGGAFTTVPLPDCDGMPCSAIVWMNDGPKAKALLDLDADAFNAEMSLRACDILGPLQRLGTPNMWPVVTQRATALTAERTVLIAEAAHVLPPIGAQGLNTSLQDVAALLRLIVANPEQLGSPKQLHAYASERAKDTKFRAAAVDLFNRICKSSDPSIQALRSLGLKAAHDIAPLRLGLMRAGIGPT